MIQETIIKYKKRKEMTTANFIISLLNHIDQNFIQNFEKLVTKINLNTLKFSYGKNYPEMKQINGQIILSTDIRTKCFSFLNHSCQLYL